MPKPFETPMTTVSPEQDLAERALFGPFTNSVRRLNEATLRTTVSVDAIAEARHHIEQATALLEQEMIPDSFGVSLTTEGKVRGHGNAVVGLRNPIAVPLDIQQSPEGRAEATFHLNALYEGPPHTVHGGVVALILDQLAGEAAAAGGSPGMTGTLSIRYESNTPLGDCSAEAWIDRVEGVKTIVKGAMRNADGEVTATCEGIFIMPRWVRELMAKGGTQPDRFE